MERSEEKSVGVLSQTAASLGMSVFGSDPDEDSGIMPRTAADWCKRTDLSGLWVNFATLIPIFFVHFGLL